MTFAPNQQPRAGMSTTMRTILFWVLMLALAVVLWKMANNDRGSGPSAPSSSMSYSDFLAQVDKNNVSSVKILESPATAEVEGQLREPPQSFRVTIPKEVIPGLTEHLQKQGASIEVSTVKNANWLTFVINVLPIIIIVALWIFILGRRRGGSMRFPPTSPTASPTPTIPTNRPLG